MAKDRRSRDQKRKAKLRKERKRQQLAAVTPYEGSKYQSEDWIPAVFRTELGIYEVLLDSNRTLSNRTVETALIDLVTDLRDGAPPFLTDDDDPDMEYSKETEREFLNWNIRRNWETLFDESGPIPNEDLIGILRTLLNSIQMHAWNTGPSMGYVHFLHNLMNGKQPTLSRGIL